MSGSRRRTRPVHLNSPDDEINLRVEVVKTLDLKFKRSDKIKTIKALIQETEGIAQDMQEILFTGIQLKDDQQLDHYGIDNFSTLRLLIPDLGAGKSIFVKLPDGKISVYKARYHDTVKKIKEMIQAWENIQSDSFALVCNGMLLEDQWTLDTANITRNSLLNVVFCPKDTLAVFVKLPTGRSLKLNVKPLFTIADVKGILGGMIDIPINKQHLFISGKALEHCKTLAFYDIKEETVLELTSSFQIYVQNYKDTASAVSVTKYSTVGDVIDSLKDPHIFKQILFHDGNELEDSRTLVSYQIKEDSFLELVPLNQIFVKAFYGGTVIVHTHKYDTLKDLKWKIRMKLNMPVEHQVIFFKGKILKGENYLLDYGIEDLSNLDLELTTCRR